MGNPPVFPGFPPSKWWIFHSFVSLPECTFLGFHDLWFSIISYQHNPHKTRFCGASFYLPSLVVLRNTCSTVRTKNPDWPGIMGVFFMITLVGKKCTVSLKNNMKRSPVSCVLPWSVVSTHLKNGSQIGSFP